MILNNPKRDKNHAHDLVSLLTFLFQKSKTMKKNMGSTDRAIRVLAAIAVAILYFSGTITGTLGIVLLVVAGVFLLTSLVGFCPLYTLLGLNTCSRKT